MRILYATNFNYKRCGKYYSHSWTKFQHSLIRSGHYVYPFSLNDMMRLRSPFGHNAFGARGMNRGLIKAVRNVEPDVLLLVQGKQVTVDTLATVRAEYPAMRIAYAWLDAVWEGAPTYGLEERLPLVDSFFLSTAGRRLEAYAGPGRVTAYIPNPVEATIDRHRAFECESPEYDLVFFGSDDAPRNEILREIRRRLPHVRCGFFGCLGNDPVFGIAKEKILARSRMAINLSRRNDVALCSSNRLGDTTANGLLNFIDAATGLQALYRPGDGEQPGEAVYFHSTDDLIAKIDHYHRHDDERIAVARAGWSRAHNDFAAEGISEFILGATFRSEGYDDIPWPRFICEDAARKRWDGHLLPDSDRTARVAQEAKVAKTLRASHAAA